MAYKKIFCPACGKPTQVDDSRDFCFCLECGNRIVLKGAPAQQDAPAPPRTAAQPAAAPEKDAVKADTQLEKKLEEAAFYIQMSVEKREASRLPEEPTFYLKAQDLLVELSSKYPEDYRVWWELCKPVDFSDPAGTADLDGQYRINDIQFNKALDLAEIRVKRQLISEYDKYVSAKRKAIDDLRAREQELRQQEEQKKREALEKQRQEEQERLGAQEREAEERQRQAREEAEKRRQEEALEREKRQKEAGERQKRESERAELFKAATPAVLEALVNRDYSAIDGSFFETTVDGQRYQCALKSVSNMLYLMAYRIDGAKNAVYAEQSITVKVRPGGEIVKFDNSPVKIRGVDPTKNRLTVLFDGETCFLSGFALKHDPAYVNRLAKEAKRPLLVTRKLLI